MLSLANSTKGSCCVWIHMSLKDDVCGLGAHTMAVMGGNRTFKRCGQADPSVIRLYLDCEALALAVSERRFFFSKSLLQ